ncbi:MAG: DUF262 domain-containing protein [Gammaproteobacteria bacterium]
MPRLETPPLDIKPKSIIKLLGSEREEFFYIPEFQRSYTWSKSSVEELINDLVDAFDDSVRQEGIRKVQYFLGTVISHFNEEESEDRLRESLLIDGQQRLTTISFILGELYKHGKDLIDSLTLKEEAIDDTIIGQLRNCIIKEEGIGESMGVIQHSDEVVKDYLSSYFNSISQTITFVPEENENNKILTQARSVISNKIKQLYDFNDSQGVDELLEIFEKFKKFSEFLLQDAVISHVSATNFADAFVIFERQNNRGEDLLFSDIVKHYLMEPISKNRENFNNRAKDINNRWLEVKKDIDSDGFSFDKFIIYFFRAEYKSLFPTEGKKALKELKKHKEKSETFKNDLENPEVLIEKLEDMKIHFLRLRNGLDLNENNCFPLLFIKKFFRFDQHYQVLMATRTLEDNEKFKRLAINLESYIFVSSFSDAGSKFEGEVINFIESIRNDNDPLQTCYSEVVCEDIDTCEHTCSHSVNCKYDTEHKIKNLTMSFLDNAESLIVKPEFLRKENANNTASERLKYIIYRIEHQYREMADEVEIILLDVNKFRSNHNLSNYTDDQKSKFSINVDHILEIGRDHFSEYEEYGSSLIELEVENLKFRVGNLTLLTRYDNGGRFNNWTPREKLLGKESKFCPDHPENLLRDEESTCRQNNCEKRLKTEKISFDNTMFALTKALSRKDVTGRSRQAKTYRYFKLDYPKLGRRKVWDEDEIEKREKIQFHILSQALLIKFDPYEVDYEIFNQINWPQFPPSD